MAGRKRIPAAAGYWRQFEIARMHEFWARPTDRMLYEIADARGDSMCQQTLPPGGFPGFMLQPNPDRPNYEADDRQRLSPAKPITDVAELGQPGIGQMVPLNIVERTDKPGERHIPLEQPEKREDESATGAGKR